MAHMFGARCSTELTVEITHVVAAKVCVTPTQLCAFIEFIFTHNIPFVIVSVGRLKLIWQEKEAESVLFG